MCCCVPCCVLCVTCRPAPGPVLCTPLRTLPPSAIAFAEERGPKTAEAAQLLAAAKLIRRLRSVVSTGNWEWVGGVLDEARTLRDQLPVCCLKELQVGRARAHKAGRGAGAACG